MPSSCYHATMMLCHSAIGPFKRDMRNRCLHPAPGQNFKTKLRFLLAVVRLNYDSL